MNTQDKINALGIHTPSDHPLGSLLKMVFKVDTVPQFGELLIALDLADECRRLRSISAPVEDFP